MVASGPETPGPEQGGTLRSYSDGPLESGCGLDERQTLSPAPRIVSSSRTHAFHQYSTVRYNQMHLLFFFIHKVSLTWALGAPLNWFLCPFPIAAIVLPSFLAYQDVRRSCGTSLAETPRRPPVTDRVSSDTKLDQGPRSVCGCAHCFGRLLSLGFSLDRLGISSVLPT